MSTIDSFKSDLSLLGIDSNEDYMRKIIDDIFLRKQFTQSGIRIIKQNHVERYNDFLRLLRRYQKEFLPDLIIVADEDAIQF